MTTKLTDKQIESYAVRLTNARRHGMSAQALLVIGEELLAEVRASRSSSGSGEREALEAASALVDEALRFVSAAEGREIPFDLHPAIRSVKVTAEKALDALSSVPSRRALASPPPSPDSGERLTPLDDAETTEAMLEERVRALEEALREARRCGDKLAKELRVWRDTYVSDDEEDPEGWLALDPEGWLALDGWAKSSDARDLALSPQGDGGTP